MEDTNTAGRRLCDGDYQNAGQEPKYQQIAVTMARDIKTFRLRISIADAVGTAK